MIPDDVSFHDAVIADIRCEGKNTVFAVEDVVVDDGEEITPGVLTFEDVKLITLDGEQVPALDMAGDDGEIVDLQVLDGPVVKIGVVWTQFDSHDETRHSYRIECGNVRWTPSD
ncbi:hypothetical protein [Leptospira sp. severe_002]|uniref:hypothetical protein n=1 Tax=Leptospira sp. severe_002 TaxID=2838237 RepID=UPI001E3B485F|nr:hypothetical protein [Leptospira sp. severe_002]